MAEQRALWQGELAAEPAARLVFVDESGANTKMTRLGGRTLVGERPATRIPLGHYQTGTPIAAVRLNGACAPWLFEGPMGGEMFLAWVWQGLVPALQPGDLLIVDYLATHKVAGVREAITSAGLLQASARALDAASPPTARASPTRQSRYMIYVISPNGSRNSQPPAVPDGGQPPPINRTGLARYITNVILTGGCRFFILAIIKSVI